MKYCLCEAPTREHDMTRYSPVGFRVCCQSGANGSLRANSLLSGKIQGNFADLAAKAGRGLGFPTISQLLTLKFPTHQNREFCRANRELFPAEQGIIQLINADGVFGTHSSGTRHTSPRLALFDQVVFLGGRPRLRRPFWGGRPTLFLGGRPTRFMPVRLAVVPRFAAGGSTVHPALRRRSIASINSIIFASASFIQFLHL
jgi:hypothetical protein